MTLENVFYTLGIIFMLSWLVFFLGIAVFGFLLYRKISSLTTEAVDKANSIAKMSKGEIAGLVISAAGSFLAHKLKSSFKKEKEDDKD